jgi:hypothetical protein
VWRIILHTESDVLRNLLVVSSVTLVLIICHSCRVMKLLQRVINFLVAGNKPKHLEEGIREYGNSKEYSIIGEIALNMHHRASICSIHPNASDCAQSFLSTQRHRLWCSIGTLTFKCPRWLTQAGLSGRKEICIKVQDLDLCRALLRVRERRPQQGMLIWGASSAWANLGHSYSNCRSLPCC